MLDPSSPSDLGATGLDVCLPDQFFRSISMRKGFHEIVRQSWEGAEAPRPAVLLKRLHAAALSTGKACCALTMNHES